MKIWTNDRWKALDEIYNIYIYLHVFAPLGPQYLAKLCQMFRNFRILSKKKYAIVQHFSSNFAQILMKCFRNFADCSGKCFKILNFLDFR